MKVNDIVWYIPGYQHPYLLAIECKIIEGDDRFGYWIDEPVGHSLQEEDFLAEEDVLYHLAGLTVDARLEEPTGFTESTLELFRERRIKGIKSTWIDPDEPWTVEYPKDKRWITVSVTINNMRGHNCFGKNLPIKDRI